MKRVIPVLITFSLLLILPVTAAADSSDWALVPIPGSDGDTFPVFFDTDTNLASDITTDISGNLFVMSGSRIIRFAPDGRLDISWGNNGIIYDDFIMRSNTEQLDIVADSRGYVYALCRICEDGSPTFLKRYAPNGKIDTSWYGDGIMGGKFYEYNDGSYIDYYIGDDKAEPKGGIRYMDEVAIDSKDNLYVLHNRKVYRFLPDGKRDRKWHVVDMVQPQYEYDEGGGGVWFDNALRIDWQDNVYLFNGYDQTVSKYNKSGNLIKKEKCGLYYLYEDEEYDESYYLINQVAFDAEGSIYNNDYVKETISKYSAGFELIAGWHGNGLLTAQNYENQQINDFISDRNGNIYTLDMERSIVSKYTREGKADLEWASKGILGDVNGDGEPMPYIDDFIFDSFGDLYVINKKENEKPIISKFTPDFRPDERWKKINVDAGWEAGSSLASYDGMLYYEIQNYESNILRINSEGKRDTEWYIYLSSLVNEMQTDKNGFLYIANSSRFINRYTPDGKKDGDWGLEGVLADDQVTGMAIDRSGYVYVSVGSFRSVSRYTPEGFSDNNWGEDGKIIIPSIGESGESHGITSIATDDAGNLYICDTVNDRILRYDRSGKPDTSWCDNGEWKSPEDISKSLMPMKAPSCIAIYKGRLYAAWNGKLYVMSDSAAQVVTKPADTEPQVSAAVAPATIAPVTAESGTAVNVGNGEKDFDWQWVIGAGGLLLCLGTALIICLLLRKKKKSQAE